MQVTLKLDETVASLRNAIAEAFLLGGASMSQKGMVHKHNIQRKQLQTPKKEDL